TTRASTRYSAPRTHVRWPGTPNSAAASSPASKSAMVWAVRLRNSADLPMASTRIETATNSKPSSAAVPPPITVAKAPQPDTRKRGGRGRTEQDVRRGSPIADLQNRQVLPHLPVGELHAVLVPLLPLQLHVAVEDVRAERLAHELRLRELVDRLAERFGKGD